jgi:hypothetical protein
VEPSAFEAQRPAEPVQLVAAADFADMRQLAHMRLCMNFDWLGPSMPQVQVDKPVAALLEELRRPVLGIQVLGQEPAYNCYSPQSSCLLLAKMPPRAKLV